MKLFERFGTAKQRKKAAELLTIIAELSSFGEAVYYEKNLLPYARRHGYGKYLELLEAVKYQLETGQRKNKSSIAVVCTALNKVLN